MSGKGKGKKGKDMGGKDNARKFASKREQTELARSLPSGSKLSEAAKPSREERGYTAPHGKKYTKVDWKQFFQPQDGKDLVGDEPDFSEEGWARRFPKK